MNLPAKEEIERALRQIIGVEHACVCLAGAEIVEIHIAASPGSRAKNVMRDVRSYLAAALGIEVDHKRISIAVRKIPGAGGEEDGRPASPHAGLDGEAEGSEETGRGLRLRLHSVQLLLEGSQARAEVRLRAGGQELIGCASGISAPSSVHRLIVRATLDAAQALFSGEARLADGDLAVVRLSGDEVLAVEVLLARDRSETRLVGACRLAGDSLGGAVRATLDAVNRVVARQAGLDWTVFRVEPEVFERKQEEAQ